MRRIAAGQLNHLHQLCLDIPKRHPLKRSAQRELFPRGFNRRCVSISGTQLGRQFMGAVGCREIGGDGIGAPAGGADLIDHGFRLVGVAAVMDDDPRAGGGERQSGGAAYAARGAGDESGFVGEVGHRGSPGGLVDGLSIVLGHEDDPPWSPRERLCRIKACL